MSVSLVHSFPEWLQPLGYARLKPAIWNSALLCVGGRDADDLLALRWHVREKLETGELRFKPKSSDTQCRHARQHLKVLVKHSAHFWNVIHVLESIFFSLYIQPVLVFLCHFVKRLDEIFKKRLRGHTNEPVCKYTGLICLRI